MPQKSCKTLADRGVTLAETIVTVGIMAIISIIVAQMFIGISSLAARQSTSYNVETSAALTLRTISEASQGASAVLTSRTINSTTYTTSESTLVLRLPTIDSSDNIIAGTYDYTAFYRDPNNPTSIYITTEPATGSARPNITKRLSSANTTMIFRYNSQDMVSANRVSIYLVNEQTSRGTTLTTRGWTSVFLHNTE